MRKSIDGLAEIIRGRLALDPFDRSLFLFCGKRRDRMKGLLWEGDGFVMLYKRLDSGGFQWPRTEQRAFELTPQQLRWLLEGLAIEQPKSDQARKKRRALLNLPCVRRTFSLNIQTFLDIYG